MNPTNPARTENLVQLTNSQRVPPTPPERSHSRGSSRREAPPVPAHSGGENDVRDHIRQRELEEARQRITQMEKTLRWWSDCTASWREKWSKVRDERNKARDESRQMKARLDAVARECLSLKQEKEQLQKDMSKKCAEHTQSGERDGTTSVCSFGSHKSAGSDMESTAAENGGLETKEKKITLEGDDEFLNKLLSKKEKDRGSVTSVNSNKSDKKMLSFGSSEAVNDDKIKLLQSCIEESETMLDNEKKEKSELLKEIAHLKLELDVLRSKFEDEHKSKSEALLQVKKLQNDREKKSYDGEDESQGKSALDGRLEEMRRELERLQIENAEEWTRREQLETEKIVLERENKKLRADLDLVQEELDRKTQQMSTALDGDLRSLQSEMIERTKELSEIKHSYTKLKKALQEKCSELEHTRSRADHYEAEVKKLRTRVDELKQDLVKAEDEVDKQSTQARKYQRNSEDLQAQMDSLRLQINHLQNRLKYPTGGGVTNETAESTEGASEGEVGDE